MFERIAAGWYNFRHWTIFRRELEDVAARWRGGRLLNLGCAHGPDFIPFAGSFELHGVDFAREMLFRALTYSAKHGFGASLVQADVTALPYAAGSFDWAIAIATYHHLRREEQPAAFAELRRVLRDGGEALVTVWSRWQPRFWREPKETLVPWHSGGETLYRYYYLFTPPELEEGLAAAGFTTVRQFSGVAYGPPARFFSENICLLVRKV